MVAVKQDEGLLSLPLVMTASLFCISVDETANE